MKYRQNFEPSWLCQSPPSRGAWIEILTSTATGICVMSPPSRGAWIEIRRTWKHKKEDTVAPLAGGVD